VQLTNFQLYVRNQIGMLGLELLQPLQQSVVLPIADLRRRLDIILVVVAANLFAKLLDLGGSGWEEKLEASEDPAEQAKIMHGMLVTDSGLTLMGSDTPNGMDYTPGNNYSVSLSGEDEAELRGFWEVLSADGTVSMALERAPWGDFFGMCTDRFGVSWLINIAAAQPSGS